MFTDLNNVKSGARTLEILGLLSTETKLTLSAISRALKLPKSSTSALLRTLLSYQFIVFDETSRTYSIGIRAFEVGSAYLRTLTGEEVIRAELRQLASRTSAASQFAGLDGAEIVYLFREQPLAELHLNVAVGGRIPAVFTALGKAMLSTLEPEALERVLAQKCQPRTAKSPTDVARIREQIEEARANGFAVDDEESSLGIICFGAPVRKEGGTAAGAVSVTVLKAQLEPADYVDACAAVVDSATRLSRALDSEAFAETFVGPRSLAR